MRNGSVLDLQVAAGEVAARVVGTRLYRVKIKVSAVPRARWNALRKACAGGIDSLVELLQGRFSKGVMECICRQGEGLFPSPKEISFDCSCPDWASMCKHVAATLYGVGARLDAKPELLFLLRQVNGKDLVATVGESLPLAAKTPTAGKVLDEARLGEIFGIEMAVGARSRETAAQKPAQANNASSGASKRAIFLLDPKTRVRRRDRKKPRQKR